MRWIGGSNDSEINREIAELDAEIQEMTHKNREMDEEIVSLKDRMALEAHQKRYLNYLTEEDLREMLEKVEGHPQSMLVVMAEEGTTFSTDKDGAVVIEKPMEAPGTLSSFLIAKKEEAKDFEFQEKFEEG